MTRTRIVLLSFSLLVASCNNGHSSVAAPVVPIAPLTQSLAAVAPTPQITYQSVPFNAQTIAQGVYGTPYIVGWSDSNRRIAALARIAGSSITIFHTPGNQPNAYWLQRPAIDVHGTVYWSTGYGNGYRVTFVINRTPLTGGTTQGCCGGTSTIGPDGRIWGSTWDVFNDSYITASSNAGTSGEQTAYLRICCGTDTLQQEPNDIVAGPDGALWAVSIGNTGGNPEVLRIDTALHVTATYHLPAGANGTAIVTGPDKALWISDHGRNAIVRVTTTGQITSYTVPTKNAGVNSIASAGGYLWFTETTANKLGRISTTGSIAEFPMSAGSAPQAIAGPWSPAAPKNQLFIALSGTKIARVTF